MHVLLVGMLQKGPPQEGTLPLGTDPGPTKGPDHALRTGQDHLGVHAPDPGHTALPDRVPGLAPGPLRVSRITSAPEALAETGNNTCLCATQESASYS